MIVRLECRSGRSKGAYGIARDAINVEAAYLVIVALVITACTTTTRSLSS